MSKLSTELGLLMVYLGDMHSKSYLESVNKDWSEWVRDEARGKSWAYVDCFNQLKRILDIEEEADV